MVEEPAVSSTLGELRGRGWSGDREAPRLVIERE
jgi:hypothetical protein